LRRLRENLPAEEDRAEARKRWKHLETPLKIDWRLSDRALYEPWIARAAGKLRESMRRFAVKDDDMAFSVANFLRQAAEDAGVAPRGSPLSRRCLALLDYLERGGASVEPGRPSHATGGRAPPASTFEIRVKYVPHKEGA
jgi:hypothetical protein